MEDERFGLSLKNKLYGREEELKVLTSSYTSVRDEKDKSKNKQIVLVGGTAGSGKSAFIRTALQQKKCLLGRGKFQRRRDSKPLSVLAHVMTEVVDAIMTSPNAEQYNTAFLDEKFTDCELVVMSKLVPKIAECSNVDPSKYNITLTTKEGLDRLKYALQHFLCVIAMVDETCPVVLCLDDLQWACDMSLDVFSSILSNSKLQHVLFVGCYRIDEIQNESSGRWIENISTDRFLKDIITSISIGDLSVSSVNDLLSDLLKLDGEETKHLAALIESRTSGNAFHIVQLLDYLQEEGLITRSLSTFKWTWDPAAIQEQTSLSENVVQIVQKKMNRLPKKVMICLQLAASLGFRFSETILTLLVNDQVIPLVTPNDDDGDVQKCVQISIEHGLVERTKGNKDILRFVHDQIYETAFQQISDEKEREQVHFKVGSTLWKHFFQNRKIDHVNIDIADIDDRTLYLCVDQLNLGSRLIDVTNMTDFSVNIGKLNLQAAKKSIAFSAFLPAIEYLEKALAMLNIKKNCHIPWGNSQHYQLTLEIYTLLAEMYSAMGKLDSALEAVNQVVTHATSIDDKVRVYLVQIHVLAMKTLYDDLLRNLRHILEELGEPLPKEPANVVVTLELQRTRRMLNKRSNDDILALPKMKEKPRKDAATKFLEPSFWALFQSGHSKLVTVIVCQMIRMMLDHGLTSASPLTLAVLAFQVIGSSKSDVDLACRLSCLSVDLSKKVDEESSSLPLIQSIVNSITSLRKPIVLVVDDLVRGYEIGMREGNIPTAFFCITVYFKFYYYSGLPLNPLAADMRRFMRQMTEYHQKNIFLVNVPQYQFLLNLTTEGGDNPVDLSRGSAIDLKSEFLGVENRNSEYRDGEQTLWSFTMQIAFLCGRMDLALEMAEKVKAANDDKDKKPVPFTHNRFFFFALIATWHAKTTNRTSFLGKKQKFVRDAKYYHKTFKGWVELGMINCVHMYQILEAEVLSLDPKSTKEQVRKAYDTAITSATRAGFLQHAAMANYLAGIYFRSEANSPDDSNYYFKMACKLYFTWGATTVVQYIYREFLSSDETSVCNDEDVRSSRVTTSSTGHRSRERFQNFVSELHSVLPQDLR